MIESFGENIADREGMDRLFAAENRWQFVERLFGFKTSRSSGKGGQNVNKVETRVTIRINRSDILETPYFSTDEKRRLSENLKNQFSEEGWLAVSSQDERTQGQNKERATERLLQKLQDALVVRAERKETRVSRSEKEKRVENKKKRGETKRLRKSPSQEEF